MKTLVNEYHENWIGGYTVKLYKTHTVESPDETSLFRKIYADFYRTYRYCNDIRFEIAEDAVREKFNAWQRNGGVDIGLYYGNGTVD